MIDALLYAVRDGIREAGINYDQASCEIMDDGRVTGACGPLYYGDITESNLSERAFHAHDEDDLAAAIDLDAGEYNLVEPPYAGDPLS